MTAVFLLMLFAAGVFVLTYDLMADVYREFSALIKKTAYSFKGPELTERGEVWEKVRLVMNITLGMGRDRAVRLFFIVSGAMSLTCMVLLSGRVSLGINMLSSVTAAFLPYLMLRIRMEKMRIKSSGEGERMLQELMDSYKIYY